MIPEKMKTIFKSTILACAFSLGSELIPAQSHELIRNGDFEEILYGWGVNPVFGANMPFDAEENALVLSPWLPDGSSFGGGMIAYQPLSVPFSGNEELALSVEVRQDGGWSPPGRTVAIYLQYRDQNGEMIEDKVLHIENEAYDRESWSLFEETVFVPGSVVRLVALRVEMEGEMRSLARNISLQSPVGGEPIPHIGQVKPEAVPFGEPFILSGKYFGEQEGAVLIGGSAGGVTVHGWTDTEVELSLEDPSVGGRIVLVTDTGVPTWQQRSVRLTSPHFRAYIRPSMPEMMFPFPPAAVPGETVRAAVFVRFFNEYSPAGGISIEFGEPGIDGCFGYPSISRAGGTIVEVETGTDWEPGLHEIEIEVSDGQLLPQTVVFPIRIKEVSDFAITIGGEDLDGQSFDRQGLHDLRYEFLDASGEPHDDLRLVPVVYSSSSPQAVDVFHEWGFHGGNLRLLVHDSAGDVTITATFPDGSSYDFNISATIPDSPRITHSYLSRPSMSNRPGYEMDPRENQNSMNIQATGAISSVGVSHPFAVNGGRFTGSGNSRGYSFYAGEQVLPGPYLWTMGGRVDGESLGAARILTVYNDPATGMISGRVVEFDTGHGHGVYGSIELYDAADPSEPVDTQWIHGDFDSYSLVTIPPGNYRLRWVSEHTRWYPNASSFEEAETIEITAGSHHEAVDFFFLPPPAPVTPPKFHSAPGFDAGNQQFSFSIVAGDNVEYVLERSHTLRENSWVEVDSTWGWDGVADLTDHNATNSKAFYRVRRR